MPDVQAIAAFDAVRSVLDEPKAIGPTRACRAAKIAPRSAMPKLGVRQADELVLVAHLDDRVRRVELHHARRAQPWDFHAQELVEKPSAVGVCAALGHGLRLRLPCGERKARAVQRAAVGLFATLAVRECLKCRYMSKWLVAAALAQRHSRLCVDGACRRCFRCQC